MTSASASPAAEGQPAGANNRVVVGDFDGTWAELAETAYGSSGERFAFPPAAAFLVSGHRAAAQAAWGAALDPGRETLIATASRIGDDQADDLRAGGLTLVRDAADGVTLEASTAPREAEAGRVWLLTSGSTGRPKQVAHTLDSLTTVGGEQPRRTWLCPYTPGAYMN